MVALQPTILYGYKTLKYILVEISGNIGIILFEWKTLYYILCPNSDMLHTQITLVFRQREFFISIKI